MVRIFFVLFMAQDTNFVGLSVFFYIFFSYSGGWKESKLGLTTLPRVSIRVVCNLQ